MRTYLPRIRARWLMAMLLFAPLATQSQSFPPVQYQARAAFAGAQLEQMLAPIALYPDALLSQILMAATYPAEVVEAARWSRLNPAVAGQAALDAVADQPWDPSVKSLVAFPHVLATMRERLQWTRDLGAAFLDQEPQVMQTVQDLRRRAWTAGTLRSGDAVRVEAHGDELIIELANPGVAHVPYYDPLLAYGQWSTPAYPPVRWSPWPGYDIAPGYAGYFLWGPAVAVSGGLFFGAFDWHRRHVVVTQHHAHRQLDRDVSQRWQHRDGRHGQRRHDADRRGEHEHRRSQASGPAEAQQRFLKPPQAPAHVQGRGGDGRRPGGDGSHSRREASGATRDIDRQRARSRSLGPVDSSPAFAAERQRRFLDDATRAQPPRQPQTERRSERRHDEGRASERRQATIERRGGGREAHHDGRSSERMDSGQARAGERRGHEGARARPHAQRQPQGAASASRAQGGDGGRQQQAGRRER